VRNAAMGSTLLAWMPPPPPSPPRQRIFRLQSEQEVSREISGADGCGHAGSLFMGISCFAIGK